MSDTSSDLAQRLGEVVAPLRKDVVVTRDLFQGEVSYILRDPINQSAHRFDAADYEILCELDDKRTLSAISDTLIDRGVMSQDDETAFYDFVVRLHQIGLLSLPISDDRTLYARYKKKAAQKAWQKVLGFLFLQVPLVNPDEFLDRTNNLIRPLFTRTFFVFWCFLMAAVGWLVINRWADLESPITSITNPDHAIGMLIALVVLKLIHELGHAYACKIFGGVVPELGAIFIVGTPCAYVDASAAWGFENKRQRIITSLAGMYFESIVAAVAIFVWATTQPGYWHSLAYQVFLLATLVTVGFNANPLMRFDGYFVMADVLGIPNLRGRSQEAVGGLFDRYALGLPRALASVSASTHAVLVGYGISSVIYKFTLVLGICTMIAMKSFYIGFALAAFYLGQTLIGAMKKSFKHLFLSPATAPVRYRAATVGILMFVGVPLALSGIPIAGSTKAKGRVEFENEVTVRASRGGIVEEAWAQPGREVAVNERLAVMDSSHEKAALAETEAEITVAKKTIAVARFKDPLKARGERARLASLEGVAQDRRARLSERILRAPQSGRIITGPRRRDRGRYFQAGEEIARIASGDFVARFLFDAESLAETQLSIGDDVDCRSLARPDRKISGRILALAPQGDREVLMENLTQIGGGEIVVNPADGRAETPYFEVRVLIPRECDVARGMTLDLQVETPARSVVSRAYRRIVKFADEVRTQ